MKDSGHTNSISETHVLRVPKAPIVVDCHTHLFPEKLFKAIRSWFEKVGWKIPYPYQHDTVISQLESFGVKEAWALTYAHRHGVAEGVNQWLGEIVKQHPLVRGFFSVHPEDGNPLHIAEQAMDIDGLDGLKLHAEVQQLAVDDPRLDCVFDCIEERGAPCVLHTGDAPYPFTKPNLDVSTVARRLEKNPELIAVIAHLGANQTESYLELTRSFPGLYLEVSFTQYDRMPDNIQIDYEALGFHRDRLLFGSDFPNLTFGYADQADAWWRLDWVKEDAEMFFGGRARQLLPAR